MLDPTITFDCFLSAHHNSSEMEVVASDCFDCTMKKEQQQKREEEKRAYYG